MTAYKSDFLNVLQERGFIHQCSDFAGLDKKLTEGVQSAYIGFDATASSLHVGSLTVIMLLYWFQQTGHKPISLMGGGTTKVGDPSGKDESRKLLDDAAINKNIEGIKSVFSKFLKYGNGPTDALMVNNDDWLKDINYISFLRDYGPHFTINRMMTFDSVKLRLEREQPLTFLEFNYMILQAYDFLELNRRYGTVLQMGASDQWGNIINGVDLSHKSDQKQLFGLTAPLLTTADGKKMGKTANGAVWLNDDMLSHYDYWQYWRNVDDAMVGTLLRRFTVLPVAEIKKLEALQGAEINEAKKILAFEATKMCRGEQAARDAAATAQKVFEQGGVGEDLPKINMLSNDIEGSQIVDAFISAKLASSRSEARRLIEGGGAKINDKPVTLDYTLSAKDITVDGFIKVSAGKKKHVLIVATDAARQDSPSITVEIKKQ